MCFPLKPEMKDFAHPEITMYNDRGFSPSLYRIAPPGKRKVWQSAAKLSRMLSEKEPAIDRTLTSRTPKKLLPCYCPLRSGNLVPMYEGDQLFGAITKLLEHDPHLHHSDLAKVLGVERHTVERVVLAHARVTFREYRDQHILRELVAMLSSRPEFSIKEVAVRLRFSSGRSLARFTHRLADSTPRDLRKALARG